LPRWPDTCGAIMQVRHHHIIELQSVRGLAATMVMLSHCCLLFATGPGFLFWSQVLINAHAALVIFFTLSGFVLARALSGPALDNSRIALFYASRVFRLYPALWLALGLSLLYMLFLHHQVPLHGQSVWYSGYYSTPATFGKILRDAVLPSRPVYLAISQSIYVEMIGSFLIPFFVLAARKSLGLPLIVVLIVVGEAADRFNFQVGVFSFLPAFMIGALGFRYFEQIGLLARRGYVLLPMLAGLLFFRLLSPAWRFETNYSAFVPTIAESFFAGPLVVGIAHRRVPILTHPAFARLGDVSYSIYLLHFTVMATLAKLVQYMTRWGELRALLLMFCVTAVTLPLAGMSYRFIELTGIALGKRLIGAFKRNFALTNHRM
jgi:peptidoglycan/LPS O-acetylase OafA/YrhL